MSTSHGLIIGLSRNEKLQKYRIIVSGYYLNKWLVHFLTYLLLPCLFFSATFLNLCKPRTTLFLLCRAGPPRLAFYGKGLACSPRWLRMVNAGWLGSMRSEIFLLIIFQGCCTKQVAILLGQTWESRDK